MPDIDGMAEKLFTALESYVERRCAALTQRCADLERQLASLPAPKDGKDADEDAIIAKVLERVPVPKDGTNGTDGAPGEKGEAGEKGMPGEKGEPGRDGKDADEEAIVARVLAAIPKPEKGKDGETGPRGEKGADGKDGESIHPDTVALMVRDAVESAVNKAMAGVRMPKDGEPGRDATHIEFLPAIDPAKSYPRGTWAKHNGGTIMAARTTDPVTATLAASGWEVMQDGIADFAVEWIDERTCELRVTRTSGEQTVTRQSFAVVLDRGVFKVDREYQAGDGVTWDGNFWIAQKDTQDKPGTSDAWRLSVRKGQNGKDATLPQKNDPVRLR